MKLIWYCKYFCSLLQTWSNLAWFDLRQLKIHYIQDGASNTLVDLLILSKLVINLLLWLAWTIRIQLISLKREAIPAACINGLLIFLSAISIICFILLIRYCLTLNTKFTRWSLQKEIIIWRIWEGNPTRDDQPPSFLRSVNWLHPHTCFCSLTSIYIT